MSTSEPLPNPDMRFTSKTHVSYAFGSFFDDFIMTAFAMRVYSFYETELYLPNAMIAWAIIIYGIWNMINDPIVGYLSDKNFKFTRKRGKRFTWFIIMSFPTAIIYLLIFVPVGVNNTQIFLWLLLLICLFDTFFSFWNTNWLAIFPFKFRSQKERTKVAAFQTLLSQIGLTMGMLLPAFFFTYGVKESYINAAIFVMAVCFVAILAMIPGMKQDSTVLEHIEEVESTKPKESYLQTVKFALKEKNFRAYLTAYLGQTVMMTVMLASIPYLANYVIGAGEDAEFLISAAVLAGGLISVPLWITIGRKYGNRIGYMCGTGLTAGLLVIFFFVSMNYVLVVVCAGLVGFTMGATWSLMYPTFSDVIDEIVVKDSSGGLVNGGRICYYFQKFDEHGNAGPMEFWDCFDFNPRVEMPVPLLETINSTGEATHKPGLKLNWFCTTPGVERFEIAVGILDGDPLPIFGKQEYVAEESNVTEMDFVTGGVTNRGQVKFYRTGRIGTTFGLEGYPLFEMENLIDLDRKYYFKIRAIGTVGTLGEWSNAEEFRWTTVPLEGPNVPWPARALPDVQNNTFHPKLSPILLDPSMSGYLADPAVGIQVGELPVVRYREDTQLRKVVVLEEYIPMDYLYTNRANSVETIMPCVLYRQQLANTLYESVSGDVVQVSPLMEQIAYGVKEIEKEYETTVYDPFIEFREGETKALEMFLIDTQPVIRGAKYQYMIMRFDPETKELDKIIPAGTITIP